MLGKLGVKAKDFWWSELQISTFSFCWACSGLDRLLVGDVGIRFRANSPRMWVGGLHAETRRRKADTGDGGMFIFGMVSVLSLCTAHP
jgi:hypothetical protein